MRRTDDTLRDRVRALRRSGSTYREIVAATRLSKRTIRRICLAAGLRRKRDYVRPTLVVLVFPKFCRRCNEQKTVFENVSRLCAECFATGEVTAGRVAREEARAV